MTSNIQSSSNKKILTTWLVLLLVKLLVSYFLPLSSDEAYYWVWSNNMQLSYFDHPPFISWLFYVGHLFEGWGHLVRLPAIVLAHSSLLIWALILKDKIKNLSVFFLFIFFSPILGLGSLILTPDLPVIFFWSLSTYLFLRILKNNSALLYSLLGMSLGLGFCSKYHIVLFPLFCILFLTIEKKWALIDFKKIIWTIVFGLFFSSPVILWNVANGFQSFAFQFKHGLGRTHWKPEWTITYFLGQFAAIFPIPAIVALRAKIRDHDRLHYYLGFGPILFFGLTSYRGVVEANWPDVGYFSIYTLFFIAATNLKPAARTISAWIALYLLVFFQYNYNFLNINTDKLREPFKYQVLIPTVDKYQPLYGGTYQMSSTLWYLTKKPFYKLRGFNRFDFFDTIQDSFQLPDKFYLLRDKDADIPDWLVQAFNLEIIETINSEFEVLEFQRK